MLKLKRNLILLLKFLADNDDFATEFASKQTVEEKYELSKTIFDGYSKDEFFELLQNLERIQNIYKKELSDNELENVSGGIRSIGIRLAAAAAMVLTTLSSVPYSNYVLAEEPEFYQTIRNTTKNSDEDGLGLIGEKDIYKKVLKAFREDEKRFLKKGEQQSFTKSLRSDESNIVKGNTTTIENIIEKLKGIQNDSFDQSELSKLDDLLQKMNEQLPSMNKKGVSPFDTAIEEIRTKITEVLNKLKRLGDRIDVKSEIERLERINNRFEHIKSLKSKLQEENLKVSEFLEKLEKEKGVINLKNKIDQEEFYKDLGKNVEKDIREYRNSLKEKLKDVRLTYVGESTEVREKFNFTINGSINDDFRGGQYDLRLSALLHIVLGDYNDFATHKSGGHTHIALEKLKEICEKKLNNEEKNHMVEQYKKEILKGTNSATILSKEFKNGVQIHEFLDSSDGHANMKSIFPESWKEEHIVSAMQACIKQGKWCYGFNESCIVYIAKVNGVNVATCVSVDPDSGEKKIMSCYPLEDQSDSETITIESPAGTKFYDKNMPKDGSDKDNFLNVLKSQKKGEKFMLTISVNDIPTIDIQWD